jgi:hypothetical protein
MPNKQHSITFFFFVRLSSLATTIGRSARTKSMKVPRALSLISEARIENVEVYPYMTVLSQYLGILLDSNI